MFLLSVPVLLNVFLGNLLLCPWLPTSNSSLQQAQGEGLIGVGVDVGTYHDEIGFFWPDDSENHSVHIHCRRLGLLSEQTGVGRL